MKKEMVINGDLLTDILAGSCVEEYYSAGIDWFVLTRTGHTFTQYETDDFLEFKVTQRWPFSRPTALKKFRESIKHRVPKLQVVDPSKMWHRGMTRGEWNAIEENNRRLLNGEEPLEPPAPEPTDPDIPQE